MEDHFTYTSIVGSPIGFWLVECDDESILGITFQRESPQIHKPENDVSIEAASQLADYFAGLRTKFRVRLNLEGYSPFFKKVWTELTKIPYGKTVSYGQLAKRIKNPKALRAVGHANAKNPFPIIIPCHRVLGSDKSLTGYAYGTDVKSWLLVHEGSWVQQGVLF